MALGVAEILAHGAGRIGRDVLHGSGFGSRCGHHDGVIHGAGVAENLHDLRNRRPLLPDRVVDADQVVALAVDDGVERDCGLAGLAVADDQLALAAADRDHAVDGLQSGRHGFAHRLAIDHARRQAFQRDELVGRDRALVVDGLTQRVDHAADQGFADGHAHDAAGALDLVAFADLRVLAQQHHADLVFFQVHGDAGDVVRELEQFSGHDFVEAVDAGNTVAQGDDRADFVHGDLGFVVLDLLPDQLRDLVCFDLCHKVSS